MPGDTERPEESDHTEAEMQHVQRHRPDETIDQEDPVHCRGAHAFENMCGWQAVGDRLQPVGQGADRIVNAA